LTDFQHNLRARIICSSSIICVCLLKPNLRAYHILVCPEQIIRFSKTQREEQNIVAPKIRDRVTIVISNWRIRWSCLLCFPFSSSTINLSPIRSSPPSYPLSFQLSYGKDAVRYGPRPSYSAQRSTREVHFEDLIRREKEREREREKERKKERKKRDPR